MSFKRVTGVSTLENDYYTLTLGQPPLSLPDGMGKPVGGALNIWYESK